MAFKRFTRYGRCIIADCYVCRCDLSIQHNDLFWYTFCQNCRFSTHVSQYSYFPCYYLISSTGPQLALEGDDVMPTRTRATHTWPISSSPTVLSRHLSVETSYAASQENFFFKKQYFVPTLPTSGSQDVLKTTIWGLRVLRVEAGGFKTLYNKRIRIDNISSLLAIIKVSVID